MVTPVFMFIKVDLKIEFKRSAFSWFMMMIISLLLSLLLLRIENLPALQLCVPLNCLFNSAIVIWRLKCCKQEGLVLSISPVSLSAGQ